ncbi:hypothetical protein [Peribacillus frigoritolerans]|uniref:hypothetical protein n=1 Tax=Peribacillus frigoritolerans TaxID=450367 RepID=UPI002079FAAC|nr:hypothetical protein [Peribacillus frigoritolerans]USK76211.1 hypothetical protein LIT31_06540 [Peribacillus frigoritolerans]
MDFSNVEKVVNKIKNLGTFEDLSYYTLHLGVPLWRIFGGQWKGIPYYLLTICEEVEEILHQSDITTEDILLYLANSDQYFFVCRNLLAANKGKSLNESEILDILSFQTRLPQEVMINRESLVCAIVSYTLDTNRFNNWDFRLIGPREKFQYEITDYKLTRLKEFELCPEGLIYDDKNYLYNRFINREKLGNFDTMPAVFKVLSDNIPLDKADFYLRLDERLSVPLINAQISYKQFSEKFRGLEFNFSGTQLEKIKNIVVHGNLETFDKLLMVIKKDYDTELNEEFWHVELEELPYMENKFQDTVCVTFIHGKYYPNLKVFKHMDFIKNQYPYDQYCKKYQDMSNNDIKIDFYTTKECHYKIWCVENIDISEETWYKVANLSLGPIYKKLFDEIIENTHLAD